MTMMMRTGAGRFHQRVLEFTDGRLHGHRLPDDIRVGFQNC